MKYKVGQVFYLIGVETAKVIPFRVIEEVTRTTLEGQEKNYIAELPDKKKTQVPVTKLKGEVFDNVADVRSHMLENARQAIDAMINSAENLAAILYSLEESSKEEVVEDNSIIGHKILTPPEDAPSVQNEEKSNIVKVDIGNGVMANMNIKDLEKVSQI